MFGRWCPAKVRYFRQHVTHCRAQKPAKAWLAAQAPRKPFQPCVTAFPLIHESHQQQNLGKAC